MTESTLKNEEAARTLRVLLRDVIEQGALEVHFEWHPELQRTLCLVRVDGEPCSSLAMAHWFASCRRP
jgi:hypothetical protein